MGTVGAIKAVGTVWTVAAVEAIRTITGVSAIEAIVTIGAVETVGAFWTILTFKDIAEDAVSGTADTATAVAARTKDNATIRLGLTLITSYCTCAASH